MAARGSASDAPLVRSRSVTIAPSSLEVVAAAHACGRAPFTFNAWSFVSPNTKQQRFLTADSRGEKVAHASQLSHHELRQYDEFRNESAAMRFRRGIDALLPLRVKESFARLYAEWDEYGLVAFRDFIPNADFRRVVATYDRLMQQHGSKSAHAHTFLDLRNHAEFIADPFVRRCFLHPLHIVLLAYRSGRPVVLVDARCKDTGAIEAVNRDNGPHMDDSWSHVEQKIFVAWSKSARDIDGAVLGPLTQPFVALARSQHLLRLWRTEFGANFSVRDIRRILAVSDWSVFPAEFKDTRPVTLLFGAARLLHHRFRSIPGDAEAHNGIPLTSLERSVCILAFHAFDRSRRWPGFLSAEQVAAFNGTDRQLSELERFILSTTETGTRSEIERRFLELVRAEVPVVEQQLIDCNVRRSHVPIAERRMSRAQQRAWITTLAETKPLSAVKPRLDRSIPTTALRGKILDVMMYDIHQDADMIIYRNGDEQYRKYMRTRLRELSTVQAKQRLDAFRRLNRLERFSSTDILSPTAICRIIRRTLRAIDGLRVPRSNPLAERDGDSLRQLARDLIECTGRATSIQEYRTYSLFAQRVLDEVLGFAETYRVRLPARVRANIDTAAQTLLQHYVALVLEDDASVVM
jgi:hypothetical protein